MTGSGCAHNRAQNIVQLLYFASQTCSILLQHLDDSLIAPVQPARGRPAEGYEIPVSPDEILSPREIEIASAFAHGDTYLAIAVRLGIAPSTVRTHLATIYRKLGVSTKMGLR